MTAYRRYRLEGGCYFFTVALAKRGGSLLTENIGGLRVAFRDVKRAHPFTMEAVVISPDHLNCIGRLPLGDDDFLNRWRQIKAAFSRQLPKTERRSKSGVQRGERGIWQRRFWEHAIRDDADLPAPYGLPSLQPGPAWACNAGDGLAIFIVSPIRKTGRVSE